MRRCFVGVHVARGARSQHDAMFSTLWSPWADLLGAAPSDRALLRASGFRTLQHALALDAASLTTLGVNADAAAALAQTSAHLRDTERWSALAAGMTEGESRFLGCRLGPGSIDDPCAGGSATRFSAAREAGRAVVTPDLVARIVAVRPL
jgi:hypothetical protein